MNAYKWFWDKNIPSCLTDENCNIQFFSNPFNVLDFTELINGSGEFDKIAEAEAVGDIRDGGGLCAYTTKLKIGSIIPMKDFMGRMIDFAISNSDPDCDLAADNVLIGHGADDSTVFCTGDSPKIGVRGSHSKISVSGEYAIVAHHGYDGNITSHGPDAQICCDGYNANITSLGRESQIASFSSDAHIYSTGNDSSIIATGRCSKIFTTGLRDRVVCDGENGIVSCVGEFAKVRAGVGCWVTLAERDSSSGQMILKTEYVDGQRIRSDKFYILHHGNFVEYD